jgi:hypothetical protein
MASLERAICSAHAGQFMYTQLMVLHQIRKANVSSGNASDLTAHVSLMLDMKQKTK